MSRNPLLASDKTPASTDDKSGNSSAIAKAYARWRLPLMRGLARFKGSIGSAEDALHDASSNGWRPIPRWTPPMSKAPTCAGRC